MNETKKNSKHWIFWFLYSTFSTFPRTLYLISYSVPGPLSQKLLLAQGVKGFGIGDRIISQKLMGLHKYKEKFRILYLVLFIFPCALSWKKASSERKLRYKNQDLSLSHLLLQVHRIVFVFSPPKRVVKCSKKLFFYKFLFFHKKRVFTWISFSKISSRSFLLNGFLLIL